MKTFTVFIEETNLVTYRIDAITKKEAELKALDRLADGEVGEILDTNHATVKDVSEVE